MRVLHDAEPSSPRRPATHPVAVLDVGAGFVAPAYAVGSPADGAVVFHRRSDHGVPGSAALGTASGLATLLDDPAVRAWVTGGGNRHLSVPRGLMPVVAQRLDLGSRGGEWDWMWTRAAPPVVPGEEHVEVLDPADRDGGRGVPRPSTARAPTGSRSPGPGSAGSAVRDAATGALVALGCSEPCAVGHAHPGRHRRRRPAAAARAGAPRSPPTSPGWRSTEAGACALGMFADNDVARRLYHRLGYTTGMEWTSRWFGA